MEDALPGHLTRYAGTDGSWVEKTFTARMKEVPGCDPLFHVFIRSEGSMKAVWSRPVQSIISNLSQINPKKLVYLRLKHFFLKKTIVHLILNT